MNNGFDQANYVAIFEGDKRVWSGSMTSDRVTDRLIDWPCTNDTTHNPTERILTAFEDEGGYGNRGGNPGGLGGLCSPVCFVQRRVYGITYGRFMFNLIFRDSTVDVLFSWCMRNCLERVISVTQHATISFSGSYYELAWLQWFTSCVPGQINANLNHLPVDPTFS